MVSLQVVACLGETKEEREAGQTMHVIIKQLAAYVQAVKVMHSSGAFARNLS